jgi:hypothetical protein
MQSTGSAASLAQAHASWKRNGLRGRATGLPTACGQSTGGLDWTGSVDVMAGRLHKLLVGRLPTSSQLPLPSNNPVLRPGVHGPVAAFGLDTLTIGVTESGLHES